MKVLLVNTYDRGGAANSCKRLHYGLLKKNTDSKILLKFKIDPSSEIFQFINNSPTPKPSFISKVSRKLKRLWSKSGFYNIPNKVGIQQKFLRERPAGLEWFSFPDSGIDITTSELYKEADIINLHWVADFLDFKTYFKKNTKPVVWTLHDMNPFTGGEHYEEKFLGIDNLGFPVNRNLTKREKFISRQNVELKMKTIPDNANLTIVAPSKWLAEEAKKSEVFKGREIIHIPYGLDSKTFYPKDREKSRELLNIPKEKKIILFVADSLDKNRKGFRFLTKAFELLEGEDILLCAVGNMESSLETVKNVQNLGTIDNEELMCAAYSAADVFVIPSLMDNLPNTVLESLMCGTPVIGFPVGGIPDMIMNGENGLLTDEISVPALHKTILQFLNSVELFNREAIRKDAIKKYDLNIQASRYITLFEDITGR